MNTVKQITFRALAAFGVFTALFAAEDKDSSPWRSSIINAQSKKSLSGLRHSMVTVTDFTNEAESWFNALQSLPEYKIDMGSATRENKDVVLARLKNDIYLSVLDELTLEKDYRLKILATDSDPAEMDPKELKIIAQKIADGAMAFLTHDVEEQLKRFPLPE